MTRRLSALAALVAILLGLGFAALQLAGSSPSQGRRSHPGLRALAAKLERPRTVVMVIFDELPLTSLMGPDGRIDAERYPGFGRLARRSVWYRGATAVHDSTALAVPAILDGRYPRRGLHADASSHPLNLFTLLAPDYELHVSEEATWLCPARLCRPEAGTTLSHLAHGRVERFRRFVRSVRPRPRPALWFKHVLLPHVPWQLFPSGRKYRRRAPEPIPGLNGYRGFGDPWLVKLSYERHLLQLGFADRLLGELLGRLRRAGLLRRALVVVVADHGIGFHVGADRRTVTPRNVADLASVPLFVKLPGQRRGVTVDDHVETIDVLPTLLGSARVRVPPGLDGRSLLRPATARARRVTIFHRIGHRLNTVGGHYSFAVDGLERRRRAALRRKLALFGSGGGREPERIFRIGPHPELVGRPIADLTRLRGRPTARIDQTAELRRVDPESGFVPAEITGRLQGGRPGGGRPLTISVNGRIAAVGRTFSLAGSRAESFAVILPEWTLRPGANDVRAFEIVPRYGRPALRPL